MQTPSDTDLGFPAKGSLKRVPFATLLRDIARGKLTGSLYLLSGDTKKVVFFVDGKPTVVRSNLASEFLGQILTDQGLINQEQCDNTLEAIRRTGKKQGELLVEMGILSEGNLRYGLEEQLRIKLFEIFGWDEGRFQFKAGAEQGNAGIAPESPMEALILAAVQERYSDQRAREALRAWGERFPAPNPKWSGDPTALDLLPEELHFLKCLDGSRTTDELLTRKHDPEVPQVATLLYGLIVAGVVEPGETKQPRRLAPLRPNLSPPNIPDDQLAPTFEQTGAIGEYEDTPLPSRLVDILGASSSKNPRIPVLPTEDEEMFAGLDVDESIVTDSRLLRDRTALSGLKSVRLLASPPPSTTPPAPAPDPLDDETDFSDLRADAAADAETDFSDVSDVIAAPTPAPAPEAAAPDSGKHKLGPPPGLGSLLRKGPAAAPAKPLSTPLAATPVTPAAAPSAPSARAASTPLPAAAPLAPPAADLETSEPPDDLEAEGDEPVDEIEELDDEEMLEDEALEGPASSLAAAALGESDDDLENLPELSGVMPQLDDEDMADEPGDLASPESSLVQEISSVTALDEDEDEDEGAHEHEHAAAGDEGEAGDEDAGDDAGLAADAGGDLDDGLDDDLLAGVDDDLLLASDDAELPDLDDLGDVDLGDVDLGEDLPEDELPGEDDEGYADEPAFPSSDSTFTGGEIDPEAADGMDTYGALRYGEAEAAMREGDYDTAVALFEDAYNAGFDVAELHAHLAFARYRASGGDPTAAQNALELLDYAESIDPGLALLHAYRGAIYVGLGATDSARECFERALYLDPYCELALEYRDSV